MSSSYRYKYIKNSSGAALTAANFPVTNDGDDKQNKLVKHVLVAADIGTGVGQVGHADGLILDTITSSYNVLWFDTTVYRPILSGAVTTYNNLTNQLFTIDFEGEVFKAIETVFWLGSDNTLRFYDKGNAQPTAKLQINDIIIAKLTIGQPQDSRDIMNFL